MSNSNKNASQCSIAIPAVQVNNLNTKYFVIIRIKRAAILCLTVCNFNFGSPKTQNSIHLQPYNIESAPRSHSEYTHIKPSLAFSIADVKKSMEDLKEKIDASSHTSKSTPRTESWVKSFVWSTIKSHLGSAISIVVGGVGSTFLGKAHGTVCNQQAPSQVNVATNALDAVVNTVNGGGTIIDNAVIRNYVSLAANQKLLPFFRTFPSHILTYSAGTVAGWTASELMLSGAGRLIVSRCPSLNQSDHLETLKRLYDCMQEKANQTSLVDVRNQRLKHLSNTLTTTKQDLNEAYHNSTALAGKLETCKDQRLLVQEDAKQCRNDLATCSKTLLTASARAAKRCTVPSVINNQELASTYISSYPRQSNLQHRTLYDDSFFIKGQCLLGVTTLHVESGDYYHGKAMCRTPENVVSLVSLVAGVATFVNFLYKSYYSYTFAHINNANNLRVIEGLQEELRALKQHKLLQVQPPPV
jgi:hypothetical protein